MSPHDPFAAHRVYVTPPAEPAPPPALPETIESPEDAFAVFSDLFATFGTDDSDAEAHAVEALDVADALAHGAADKLLVALEAIRAGLVGEWAPLAGIGVEVDPADVDAKAAELGDHGVVTMADLVRARWDVIEAAATRFLSTPMAATEPPAADTDGSVADTDLGVADTIDDAAATDEPLADTADTADDEPQFDAADPEPQFDALDPQPGPTTEPAALAEEPTAAEEPTPAELAEPATSAEETDDEDPYVVWLRGQIEQVTGKPADKRFGRPRLEAVLAEEKAKAAGAQAGEPPAPSPDAE